MQARCGILCGCGKVCQIWQHKFFEFFDKRFWLSKFDNPNIFGLQTSKCKTTVVKFSQSQEF